MLSCKPRLDSAAVNDKVAVHEEGLFEKILAEGQGPRACLDKAAVHDQTRLPCTTTQTCRACTRTWAFGQDVFKKNIRHEININSIMTNPDKNSSLVKSNDICNRLLLGTVVKCPKRFRPARGKQRRR